MSNTNIGEAWLLKWVTSTQRPDTTATPVKNISKGEGKKQKVGAHFCGF